MAAPNRVESQHREEVCDVIAPTLPVVYTLKDALEEAKSRLRLLELDRPAKTICTKRSKRLSRRPEGVFRLNAEDGSSLREEAELQSYLEDFKRESKLLPSTIKIQSWCRMRQVRRRYRRCFVQRKRSVREVCWRRWVLYTSMSKYSVQAQQRLYFLRWLLFTREEQDLRDLWRRMLGISSHNAEKGLMKLFSWATRTLNTSAKASIPQPSAIRVSAPASKNFDSIILKAFFNSWRHYLRVKLRRRKLAAVHLQRARRLGRKTMWAPERAKLCLVLWHRYAVFKRCKRQNVTVPNFEEDVVEWSRFMNRRLYLQQKGAEAEKRAPRAILKRKLREWQAWVSMKKHLLVLDAVARAHYQIKIKNKLLMSWNRFTKERGKKLRSVRRCLVSWGLWAKRKRRNRLIKEQVVSNVLSHGKRVVLRHWHEVSVEHQRRTLLSHQHFFRDKYTQTLKVVMALSNHRIQVVFLGIWQRWTKLAKHRASWNRVQYLLAKQCRLKLLARAWQKLSGSGSAHKIIPKVDLCDWDKRQLRRLLLSESGLRPPETLSSESTDKIQLAVSEGNLPLCLQLIKDPGVDLTMRNVRGESLLHLACKPLSGRQVSVVILLLKIGLSPESKDCQGNTPRSVAVHPTIMKLLEAHSCRINDMVFTESECCWYRQQVVTRNFCLVTRFEMWKFLQRQLKDEGYFASSIASEKHVSDISLEDYKSHVNARCRVFHKRMERDELLLRRHLIRQGFAAYSADVDKKLPLPFLELGVCYPLSTVAAGGEKGFLKYCFVTSQVPNETRLQHLQEDIAAAPQVEEVEGDRLWDEAVSLWEMSASRADQIEAWKRCYMAYDDYLKALNLQAAALEQARRCLEKLQQDTCLLQKQKEDELQILKGQREKSAQEILKKTKRHQRERSAHVERSFALKKKLSSAKSQVLKFEEDLASLQQKLRKNNSREQQIIAQRELASEEVKRLERCALEASEKISKIDLVYQQQCHSNLEAMQEHSKEEDIVNEALGKTSKGIVEVAERIQAKLEERQEHDLYVAEIRKRRDAASEYAENPLLYNFEEPTESPTETNEDENQCVAEETPQDENCPEQEKIETWIADEERETKQAVPTAINTAAVEEISAIDKGADSRLTKEVEEPTPSEAVVECAAEIEEASARHSSVQPPEAIQRSSNFDEQAYWKAKRRQLPPHQDPLLELTLPVDKQSQNIQRLLQEIQQTEEEKHKEFIDKVGLLVVRDSQGCIDELTTTSNFEELYEKCKRLVFGGELLKAKSRQKTPPGQSLYQDDGSYPQESMFPLDCEVSSLESEDSYESYEDVGEGTTAYLFGNFVGSPRQQDSSLALKESKQQIQIPPTESVWLRTESLASLKGKLFWSDEELQRVEELNTTATDLYAEEEGGTQEAHRFTQIDFEISPNETLDESRKSLELMPLPLDVQESQEETKGDEARPALSQEKAMTATIDLQDEKEKSPKQFAHLQLRTGTKQKSVFPSANRIHLKVAIRDGVSELDVSYSLDDITSDCSTSCFGKNGTGTTSSVSAVDDDEELTSLVLEKLRLNREVLSQKCDFAFSSRSPTRTKPRLEPLSQGPFVSKEAVNGTLPLNRHILFDPFAVVRRPTRTIIRRSSKRVGDILKSPNDIDGNKAPLELVVGRKSKTGSAAYGSSCGFPSDGSKFTLRRQLPVLQPLFHGAQPSQTTLFEQLNAGKLDCLQICKSAPLEGS